MGPVRFARVNRRSPPSPLSGSHGRGVRPVGDGSRGSAVLAVSPCGGGPCGVPPGGGGVLCCGAVVCARCGLGVVCVVLCVWWWVGPCLVRFRSLC